MLNSFSILIFVAFLWQVKLSAVTFSGSETSKSDENGIYVEMAEYSDYNQKSEDLSTTTQDEVTEEGTMPVDGRSDVNEPPTGNNKEQYRYDVVGTGGNKDQNGISIQPTTKNAARVSNDGEITDDTTKHTTEKNHALKSRIATTLDNYNNLNKIARLVHQNDGTKSNNTHSVTVKTDDYFDYGFPSMTTSTTKSSTKVVLNQTNQTNNSNLLLCSYILRIIPIITNFLFAFIF